MINDTVKILKLVEERNNQLTEESISYPGERYYFNAGNITGKNISFTITYKKSVKELGYQAESNNKIGTELLKKVFSKSEDLLNNEVGLKLSLDQADRNPNWYRLRTKIIIDDSKDLIEQIDKIVMSFDKFRHMLRLLVNDIDISEIEELKGNEKNKGRKMSSDSWVDEIKINDSNFLGRKTMDYSMFNHGTFIPERYKNKFLKELSKTLKLGHSISIKLIIDGVEYQGRIDMPNSKNRKTPAVRFLYSSKSLKELLKENLQVSYEYIMNYIQENDKKPNTIPNEYAEYIDFYKGHKVDEFILKLITKNGDEAGISEEDIESTEEVLKDEYNFTDIEDVNEELDYIHNYITSKGFVYSKELIQNFYLSLKTKPFVILSGISGTGKSKIVELFAEAIGAKYSNNRFKLVPVKPDWSDATDLLGYRNIEGKFTPGIITLLAYEAMKNPDLPYFICLDEMNLARVEYYFSDILSLMETRRVDEDLNIVTEKLLSKEQFGRDERSFDKYGDVCIPENLYIVGTVNMDETTFPFSKKVLDRANTIEFNKVDLSYDFDDIVSEDKQEWVYHNKFLKTEYLKIADCKEHKDIAIKVINELIAINNILESYNQHFGFRVRDEIVFYMINALKDNIMDFNKALDYCIVQKILPKINGSNGDVLEILIKIFNLLNSTNIDSSGYLEEKELNEMVNKTETSEYELSSQKLVIMVRRFIRDGFTTFWQ